MVPIPFASFSAFSGSQLGLRVRPGVVTCTGLSMVITITIFSDDFSSSSAMTNGGVLSIRVIFTSALPVRFPSRFWNSTTSPIVFFVYVFAQTILSVVVRVVLFRRLAG